MRMFLFFFLLFSTLTAIEKQTCDAKVLICGVCRNVEQHFAKNVENLEGLANLFADYHMIIYENNSMDNTQDLFKNWSQGDPHITFLSENVPLQELPACRTEKIARARNIVLSAARDKRFSDYEYLIMVDLDSAGPWPFEEIINTIQSKREWDCVSANSLYLAEGFYRDRYALRDTVQPLGPEILGDTWWGVLNSSWFVIAEEDWYPVFSAFGGLAIYKTKSILPFSYSGTVTDDLRKYYEYIFTKIDKKNLYRILYLGLLGREKIRYSPHKPVIIFHPNTSSERPSDYPYVTVCEHVTLHAAMAQMGYGKFFVNPKMKVRF